MNGADDWRNWALLACLGLIWGASFMFVGVAVREIGPLSVAAGRLAIATATLLPLAILLGHRLPRTPRLLGYAVAVAFLSNAAPFTLLAWGQQTVPSAVAGVYMAAMPLLILPLSHFLIPNERINRRKSLGFAVGFVGVLVLIGRDTLSALGTGGALPQLACLGAVLGYALGSISLKRAGAADPLAFAALTMGIATLMTAPLALIGEAPFSAPVGLAPLASVVMLGLTATALALLLMMKILSRAGPPFLSMVNYQVPLWATFFGATLLGESLPGRLWPALALILCGIAISQGVFARRSGAP